LGPGLPPRGIRITGLIVRPCSLSASALSIPPADRAQPLALGHQGVHVPTPVRRPARCALDAAGAAGVSASTEAHRFDHAGTLMRQHNGQADRISPLRTTASVWHMPVATMRTSTSSARGGSSVSVSIEKVPLGS